MAGSFSAFLRGTTPSRYCRGSRTRRVDSLTVTSTASRHREDAIFTTTSSSSLFLLRVADGACRAARWQSASALASRSRHRWAASALPSPRPLRSSLLLASGSSSSLDDSSFLSSPLSPFSPEATRAWASAAFLASSSALSLACGRREREATGAPSVPVAPHAVDAVKAPQKDAARAPRVPCA